MAPGDMPDVDPALRLAYDALTNPKHELATRHIIFISDGDHWDANPRSSGRPTEKQDHLHDGLHHVTRPGRENQDGRRGTSPPEDVPTTPTNPNQLPAIYIQETRFISQSLIYEKRFQPATGEQRGGPLEGIKDLPVLRGYVRTTPKQAPTVQHAIVTPPVADQEFPILAYWHYGLGKAVAFTSDASPPLSAEPG